MKPATEVDRLVVLEAARKEQVNVDSHSVAINVENDVEMGRMLCRSAKNRCRIGVLTRKNERSFCRCRRRRGIRTAMKQGFKIFDVTVLIPRRRAQTGVSRRDCETARGRHLSALAVLSTSSETRPIPPCGARIACCSAHTWPLPPGLPGARQRQHPQVD
jgi:hypothetical protein